MWLVELQFILLDARKSLVKHCYGFSCPPTSSTVKQRPVFRGVTLDSD